MVSQKQHLEMSGRMESANLTVLPPLYSTAMEPPPPAASHNTAKSLQFAPPLVVFSNRRT
uniref:Uncharacterized protein n=1 Tax=Trypanosoma brucei TaxID=5691 RepID=Q581M3_9TRYP|nr:hypothetical protein, unlikely [Trypanosoma brucei]AAX80090.1 hypothetical protein, unlikely [Trypanosoma brucei]AAX80093.1 hypothetical protein, unlikely [Trypanosoma brucei]